jgi:GTP-binding protein
MTGKTPKPKGSPKDPAKGPTIKSIEFIKSATRPEHHPTDGLPQVCFVGRSNVGKSSLLNLLANRKQLAHVSRTPGRTQLINFFRVNNAGYFVDVPGYGFASAPKSVQATWDKMISGLLTGNPYMRAACVLLDVRRDAPTPDDQVMMEWLHHNGVSTLAVLTKCDKLSRNEMAKARRSFAKALEPFPLLGVVETSADARTGREELLGRIFDLLWPPVPEGLVKAVGAAKDLEEAEAGATSEHPG